VPVVLTIAGSDNSGGAGIQADLKTFTTLGVYGTTAVTCVVAEHPGRVLNITPIPPERVADQIRLVLEAFPVAAIKTGMLYSAEIIAAVEEAVARRWRGRAAGDRSGHGGEHGKRAAEEGRDPALRKFIARATIVTPNRDEAALLWGKPITIWRRWTKRRSDLAKALSPPLAFWRRAAISKPAGGRCAGHAGRPRAANFGEADSGNRSARHRLHLFGGHRGGIGQGMTLSGGGGAGKTFYQPARAAPVRDRAVPVAESFAVSLPVTAAITAACH
jgi:hypothetical protein